jgi:hypothetical protein
MRWWPAGAARPCQVLALFELLRFDVDEKIKSEKISVSSCKDDTHNLHKKNDTEKMNTSTCCTSPVLPAMGAGGDEGAAGNLLSETTRMTPNKDTEKISMTPNKDDQYVNADQYSNNKLKTFHRAIPKIAKDFVGQFSKPLGHYLTESVGCPEVSPKLCDQFTEDMVNAFIQSTQRMLYAIDADAKESSKSVADGTEEAKESDFDKLFPQENNDTKLDGENNDIESDPNDSLNDKDNDEDDDWLNTAQDDDDDEVEAETDNNFGVGDFVLVHGLLRAPHLNNLMGAIEGYDALADRFIVSFAPKVTPTKIKACNLMFPARCPYCTSEVTGSHCHACPSGELLLHESIRIGNSSSMNDSQTDASFFKFSATPRAWHPTWYAEYFTNL